MLSAIHNTDRHRCFDIKRHNQLATQVQAYAPFPLCNALSLAYLGTKEKETVFFLHIYLQLHFVICILYNK